MFLLGELLHVKQKKANLVDYRNVKKVQSSGIWFDSKAEKTMYEWLVERAGRGELSDIRCQVPIDLLPGPRGFGRKYWVDFVVRLPSGEDLYLEVKGWETDRWKANKLLWRHLGPGVLQIWKVSWEKLIMVEELVPDTRYLVERLGLEPGASVCPA